MGLNLDFVTTLLSFSHQCGRRRVIWPDYWWKLQFDRDGYHCIHKTNLRGNSVHAPNVHSSFGSQGRESRCMFFVMTAVEIPVLNGRPYSLADSHGRNNNEPYSAFLRPIHIYFNHREISWITKGINKLHENCVCMPSSFTVLDFTESQQLITNTLLFSILIFGSQDIVQILFSSTAQDLCFAHQPWGGNYPHLLPWGNQCISEWN